MRRFAMMVLAAALGSATAVAARPAEATQASILPHAPAEAAVHQVRYDGHWREHRRAREQARIAAAARREARRIERERAERRAWRHARQHHYGHRQGW
ncbi:MAG TPA: hypothetical protein VNZ61_25415 [Roseomonas sp.]|nr:hypothetical protein [Roseomonas sp.]